MSEYFLNTRVDSGSESDLVHPSSHLTHNRTANIKASTTPYGETVNPTIPLASRSLVDFSSPQPATFIARLLEYSQ